MTALSFLLTALIFIGDEPEVKAELIPTKAEISPGETTLLAMHLKLEPGWHVYWQNPGDSGLATTMQVKGPEGFAIGPVLYPAPERIEQPGGLVCYGYEDTACLFVEVTAPESLEGDEFEFTAEAQWLVCDEVCFYGEAKLSTKLGRHAGGELPAPDKRLESHLERLPQPLSSWPGATVELSGSITEPLLIITLPLLEGPTTKTPSKENPIASFYPLPDSRTKLGSFEILEDELRIRGRLFCRFKPSENHKTPTIRGVLTVTLGSHTQRSLSIEPKWPSKVEDT